jgi:hypothetical protein
MEPEDLALWKHLAWWKRAIRPELPSIVPRIIKSGDGPDGREDGLAEEVKPPALNEAEDRGTTEEEDGGKDSPDEEVAELERCTREHVAACLERLQQELASLMERWHCSVGRT